LPAAAKSSLNVYSKRAKALLPAIPALPSIRREALSEERSERWWAGIDER